MVVAGHPEAAEAGLAVLRSGGSAVDAAVAVSLALGVAEPYGSGLGGKLMLLHYEAATGVTLVIDAMDALSPKCGLIAEAANRKLPVVTVGGCAGRLDGTRIKITDLRDSRDDPLMMLVRKRLRQNFDFPRGKAPFGVSCVWSDEPFTQPTDCEGLPGGEIPEGEDLRPNCEWGYGTASHVAGAFGLAAAGEALRLSLLRPE